MKTMQILFLSATLAWPLQALALSKQYDFDAAAKLKNGQPCFYLLPDAAKRSQPESGIGISATVYAETGHGATPMWHMRSKSLSAMAPVSPDTCLVYGTASVDENRQHALPLQHDQPYSFSLDGAYGSNMAFFCLRRDAQGKDYLSKVRQEEHECAVTPLMAPDDRNFLQRLFDVQPW